MGLPEAWFLAPTHPIHPPTNTHIKPARYYSDHSGLGFGLFQAKHPLWLTWGHGVSCLLFSLILLIYITILYLFIYITYTYVVYHTYVYVLLHKGSSPAAHLWPRLRKLIFSFSYLSPDHRNSHILALTPTNYSSSFHSHRINDVTFYVYCVMLLCTPKHVWPEREFHK